MNRHDGVFGSYTGHANQLSSSTDSPYPS